MYLIIACEDCRREGHGWGHYEPAGDPDDDGGYTIDRWPGTRAAVLDVDLTGCEDHDLSVVGEE
jgi:hypothetical protein